MGRTLALVSIVIALLFAGTARADWRGTGPPGNAVAVVVDPLDPETIYAVAELYASGQLQSSLFRRTGGVSAWGEVARAPINSRISALCVSPFNSSVLYASTTSLDSRSSAVAPSTLYRSLDRGATWDLIKTFPFDLIDLLAIDPHLFGSLYAGGEVLDCDFPGCARGRLYMSQDAGISWTQNAPGLGAVTVLLVDPSRAGVLYAGTALGPFKSTDAGLSWKSGGRGLEECSTLVTAMAIDPRDPNVVYVGVYQSAFNDAGCAGVFKSVNGMASWKAIGPRVHVSSLAVDPTDSRVVDAGGLNSPYFFRPPPGLFETSDGGANWSAEGGRLGELGVNALAFDPSGTLHVATESGVFEFQFGPERPRTRPVPFRGAR